MGKPIAIPRILGIDWWWVFIAGLLESYLRHAIRVPDWVPSLTGLWFLVQAGWLKLAEPQSWAIYFYVVSGIGDAAIALPPLLSQRHPWTYSGLALLFGALGLVGVFVFRTEMVRHFTETEPRGIELGGVMTFFFSGLYFQYWFHQIYQEQNDADLRLV